MGGIILGGAVEHVPGLTIQNWQDDPKLRLKMTEDCRRRPPGSWVRGIGVHTTRGLPFDPAAKWMADPVSGAKLPGYPRILQGVGPKTNIARNTVGWWSLDQRHAGAHLVVDYDGGVACLADLTWEETYHAGPVNERTIGIEIAQRPGGELYEAQLASLVILCDWLTLRLRIQRQIPHAYEQGQPLVRCRAGGRDVVGVYGHRDITTSRGWGDPGDAVFAALERGGYERFDFAAGDDLERWKVRQAYLGSKPDGVPGPKTCGAIATWQEDNHHSPTGVLTRLQREELDRAAEGA